MTDHRDANGKQGALPMSEIIFYTNPMSRGRIVRWMLEELGQPYETRVLAYGPPMKSPDYLAINPMGKVPAVQHGEAIVTEAAACCAYLAAAFPEAGLAPEPGTPESAAYLRDFVVEAKASGLVAELIARHQVDGLSVAS